jgi:hypothetical protein
MAQQVEHKVATVGRDVDADPGALGRRELQQLLGSAGRIDVPEGLSVKA